MESIKNNEFSKNIIRILKGSMISICITILLLFIFAIVLTYTSVQESSIKPVIIIVATISVLIGSSISTLKIKKRGFLNGGAVGLIYISTLYLILSISGIGLSFNIYSLIMIIGCVIAGIIGGIIGVNFK